MTQNDGNPSASTTQTGESNKDLLDPENVKKITDMVYRLLLENVKLEQERSRFKSKSNFLGGW